jgi:hypothetical protein
MNRMLSPEWLDELPVNAREALDSRRDLRRLNAFLRHPSFVAEALLCCIPRGAPRSMVELGAGDGSFLLKTASLLAHRWPSVHAILVDRNEAASNGLRREFARIGWTMEIVTSDVFDWLEHNEVDAAVANLFLHHFDQPALERLLRLLSVKSTTIVACEPRRALLPLGLSHLLGLAGANAVTRHDAPISVRAGFRKGELTSLWPSPEWRLEEYGAGLCSHLFVASRSQ